MKPGLLAGLTCAACAAGALAAGDPSAGQALAESCAACHGAGGAEPIENYPIIAGQHESYLLKSMLSYQQAERSNAVMNSLLADFSEQDLADMAAYFAAQPSKLR